MQGNDATAQVMHLNFVETTLLEDYLPEGLLIGCMRIDSARYW